jgi:A/G-specific adenine glycosylase
MQRSPKSKEQLHTVQKLVLRWYRVSGRPLPWRKTRNPYRILISEVMLQQTQVARVLEKYPRFLRRYPTLKALANTRIADVLRSWRGMGYNKRALRLRELAQTVQREHSGSLPRTIAGLHALPGIGRYTSHALACFAYGLQTPVVDTNIQRVLRRVFPNHGFSNSWDLAEHVLPTGKAYEWNQALMDLGSTICTAAGPRCSDCPIRSCCPSAFGVHSTSRRTVRREPQRDGVPNRIYRGRVIEILRALKGKKGTIRSAALARRIKHNYSLKDKRWFTQLLAGLHRDGLIAIRGGLVSFPQ